MATDIAMADDIQTECTLVHADSTWTGVFANVSRSIVVIH